MEVKWTIIGSNRLVFKWYWIDIQIASHWQSKVESQVVTDWSSSGRGLTVKWCNIGSLIKTVQVVMDLVTDWSSSGMGSTVKWSHIGSLMMKVKW